MINRLLYTDFLNVALPRLSLPKIESHDEINLVRQFEEQHHTKYKKHRFIHCCNTLVQQEMFQEHGLNAIFLNHLCFVDENIYKPLEQVVKVYDAIYDARFKDYKRHYLAVEINNLALIYYSTPEEAAYVEEVRQQLDYAHYFNHPHSEKYKFLTSTEVNQCLNMCRVGLCLSKTEGAMYASIQYLLSGLPVVSTKSEGGRDVFFDDEYVLIVEDNPEAVKDGVQKIIKRNIPSDYIRRKTLAKMQPHRERLISLVQSIYDQEGIDRNFSLEWSAVFFNRMVRLQNNMEVIKLFSR